MRVSAVRGWRGAAACLGCCKNMKQPRTHDLTDASPLEQADVAAAGQLARHRHHLALHAATEFSQLADQPPLLAASAAVMAWGLLRGDRHLARRAGYLLASVGLATLLKGAVKRLVSRTRPNVLLDRGLYRVQPLGPDEGPWHSFPSGHTTGAVALARALARCWPASGRPAYAAAAAVGVVQVPRGAHYPSDVLAGAVLGVTAEHVLSRLFPPAPAPGRPVRDTPRSVRR
jgi:membrane-associated phospholipid phosphatase